MLTQQGGAAAAQALTAAQTEVANDGIADDDDDAVDAVLDAVVVSFGYALVCGRSSSASQKRLYQSWCQTRKWPLLKTPSGQSQAVQAGIALS